MNITKQSIDALNAVLTVEIEQADYQDAVTKVLKDYRKNANVPGFRKGHLPMGLVKKQYGKAVKVEEINKVLQKALNSYIIEEKLDILGAPLPKMTEDFDWDNEKLSFDFELGLAPEIKVSFPKKDKLTAYKIVADKELIDREVENLQKKFGALKTQNKVQKKSSVNVTFVNEEKEINKDFTFDISATKDSKSWTGKKVNDTITVSSQELFTDNHLLMNALGITHDEAHDLDVPVTCTINEISYKEPAELNQELFDKIFGKDKVKSEEELREKLKEDAEKQFAGQSDQQLLNSVTDYLIDNTSFDLPDEFLKRWIQTAGQKELTPEEAEEEYNNSLKGIRYQLIEEQIRRENENLQVTQEELQNFIKERTKAQLAQFGMLNPTDEELNSFIQHIASNQEEVRNMENQLKGQKLLDFYKEKISFKTKEVNYEDFFKEVYKIEK